jgi:hypothetical protein
MRSLKVHNWPSLGLDDDRIGLLVHHLLVLLLLLLRLHLGRVNLLILSIMKGRRRVDAI